MAGGRERWEQRSQLKIHIISLGNAVPVRKACVFDKTRLGIDSIPPNLKWRPKFKTMIGHLFLSYFSSFYFFLFFFFDKL